MLILPLMSGSFLAIAPAFGETLTVTSQAVIEWKPVYAEVETRDRVPARARIGGTISALDVTEGDMVEAGQRVAIIEDTKLLFQIEGIDAQLDAYGSQLDQAQADLDRGQSLSERGVISNQSLQALQTNVNVLEGQITSLRSERQVVARQIEEGEVLAPEAGLVLSVPVSKGGVVFAGEEVATIGAGGAFLRLGVSERYADTLKQGDTIEITEAGGATSGTLAKIYPLIEGGRVQADVEVEGLETTFVGRRVQVRLPVGSHEGLLVPATALTQSGGLDFVTVDLTSGPSERVVVPGNRIETDGVVWVEILSGLTAGDVVVTSHE
tara:strand:+ start:125966 stop:126937 length:972 start_codon:yes stop_codon:yes gene_type:complete